MELTAVGTLHMCGAAVTVAAGFDVEVQLVMKDHRTAVGLEQNQISHLRHRARGSEHRSTEEN